MPVEVENQPRNVAQMKDFGNRLGDFEDTDEPVMDLNNLEGQSSIRSSFLRQSDAGEETTETTASGGDDDAIRCIPKVMQVSDLPTVQITSYRSAKLSKILRNVYLGIYAEMCVGPVCCSLSNDIN